MKQDNSKNNDGLIRRANFIFNLLKNRELKTLTFGSLYYLLNKFNLKLDELRYSIKKLNKSNIILIYLADGNKININLSDEGICRELTLQKKREIFSSEFFRNFLDEEEIIVDIGANIGYYVIIESNILKKGEIYAIEPVPTNMELLKSNIILNDIKNIKSFQFAVGEENGSSKMYVYNKCNLSKMKTSSLSSKNLLSEIEVETVTLDTFIDKQMEKIPTLIRMDVEGYEYNIFKGANKLFENDSPLKITMEIHPHLMNKEGINYILTTLKKHNFKIKAIILDPENHNFKSINIINFLRKNMGLLTYGTIPTNSYEDLENILYSNVDNYIVDVPVIFLERN